MQLCQPEMHRHNVATQVSLHPDLPQVMVDRLQIEQVLINLVRNSVEAIASAGHGGGTITIRATRVGSKLVELQLADTGPGFPLELATADIPLLSSNKPEGLGFGLSLSRSIVEAHGGTLNLDSAPAGALVSLHLANLGGRQSIRSESP